MLSGRDKLKYHIKTRICHVKTNVSFFRPSFFNMAGDGFDLPNKTTVMNVDTGIGCSIGDKLIGV
jgi:hypothetical protein